MEEPTKKQLADPEFKKRWDIVMKHKNRHEQKFGVN